MGHTRACWIPGLGLQIVLKVLLGRVGDGNQTPFSEEQQVSNKLIRHCEVEITAIKRKLKKVETVGSLESRAIP